MRRAGYGACKLHLGSVGTHVVRAERLRIADEEARIAAEYGLPREVSVVDALLEGLYVAAGRVDFWDSKVRTLDDLSERGQAGRVDVHHFVRASERAHRDYQKVAVDCGKLGLEARREAIDRQGREILLEILHGTVRWLGADPTDPAVQAQIDSAFADAIAAAEAAVWAEALER